MNEKLYNIINNILYEEIIPECSQDKLIIGDIKPAIYFAVNIEGRRINSNDNYPCLVINDKNTFNKYLYNYVVEALKFYYDNNYTHDNIKSLISYLIANLTDLELSNPIPAIISRTNMLKNDLTSSAKTIFLDYDCTINVSKIKPFLEAPYSFDTIIKNNDEEFMLPSIIFGIDKDKCLIYAIQNKNNMNNNLKKKLNRLFYKFNDKVEDTFDSEHFNITDVTMSFIASIIMFINYLNEQEIKNIDVKLNMPIRYNNHFSSNERRLDYKKKYLSEDEFIKYKEMIDRQNESYKDNIILKLVRTFYRVKEMGDVININYMPFNISDSINISINKNGSFNNDLCNLIYKKNNNIKK